MVKRRDGPDEMDISRMNIQGGLKVGIQYIVYSIQGVPRVKVTTSGECSSC